MLRNRFTLPYFVSLILVLFVTFAAQAQSSAAQEKTVDVYGQKISYLEAGSGPKVILLHGLGGDATNWTMTLPALAKNYHVFVPDQIGFGKSDKPFINYRVSTLVEFLNKFCEKLGIEKATLVGNSLGGWTAAAFAIAYPNKVEKLVLVCAAGYTNKRWGGPELSTELTSGLNPATPADLKRGMQLIFYNKAILTDGFIEQAFTAKLKRGDGQTINAFIESFTRGEDFVDEKVKSIKAPTLVLWGREDGLVPIAVGKAFAEDIKGSQMVVIEQCGHVPQIEKPAEFNTALLKFLAGGASTASK